jgi:dTDP-4-amino-4,6-dideoxygalactose transaminase
MKLIPFSPPYIDKDVIKEVKDTLNSGWITSGPKVKLLENEFDNYIGCQKTICVNSWTSGAIMILKWLGIGDGDEVIIPAYTYCATALAILHVGAKPVFVDALSDFTIDFNLVEKKITSKTKAIIPVDFAGWPCNYDQIYNIVHKKEILNKFKPNSNIQEKFNRIVIISDAAHSFGATYNSKKVGLIADITIFSLHAVKNLTTAEGGAICLNLPEIFEPEIVYKDLKLLSLNGQTKDALSKNIPGSWKYDIILPGLKINMPDVCAAIGLAQIRKYDDKILTKRESKARLYYKFFKKYNFIQLPDLNNFNGSQKSSFHIFPLRFIDISELQRDLIIENISTYLISVNVHFIPLPMLTLFKSMGYDINDYPVSYDNYSREISLPIYPQLTKKQILYISKIVVDSYFKIITK